MNAVWLLSTRPTKLALMIDFVSNGGISLHIKQSLILNVSTILAPFKITKQSMEYSFLVKKKQLMNNAVCEATS